MEAPPQHPISSIHVHCSSPGNGECGFAEVDSAPYGQVSEIVTRANVVIPTDFTAVIYPNARASARNQKSVSFCHLVDSGPANLSLRNRHQVTCDSTVIGDLGNFGDVHLSNPASSL